MPALERPVTRPRPVYLNLVRIRLPLPGIVSILHRVSGVFGDVHVIITCVYARRENYARLYSS